MSRSIYLYKYCRDPFKKHRRRIHLHLRVASEKLIAECPSLSLRSRDLLCVLEWVTTILVKIDRSRHDTKHFVEKKNTRSCPNKETLSAESCYLINPHVGGCDKTVHNTLEAM